MARDEETGQSGLFPVTALMTRQALDVVWLTLEDADGKTSRMGVTSKHPLFTAGEGWIAAGELVAGEAIRDSALQLLRVLNIELDAAPQIVRNLEVAEAHTYFDGELEAWGHDLNLKSPLRAWLKKFAHLVKRECGVRSESDLKIDVDTDTWIVPNQKNNKGGFPSYKSGFNKRDFK